MNNILEILEELPVIMHIFAFPNIFSFSHSLFPVYKANLLQRVWMINITFAVLAFGRDSHISV